jgi:hypothetical protein
MKNNRNNKLEMIAIKKKKKNAATAPCKVLTNKAPRDGSPS